MPFCVWFTSLSKVFKVHLHCRVCIRTSFLLWLNNSTFVCCSVIQLCLTLCEPIYCSMPGFPVFHHLLELAQTYVHWVSDSIQPSCPCHPLLPLPPVFPSIRIFSNESDLHIRWPKCWSFSFIISPSNEYFRLISFRIDSFILPTVQGTCMWKWKLLSRVRLFATPWTIQSWNSPGQKTGVGSLPFSRGSSQPTDQTEPQGKPNTTVRKHQFFSAQPSLWSNSHICTWLLEKPSLWLYRPLPAK